MMVKRPAKELLDNAPPDLKAYIEELDRVHNMHK